MPATASRLSSAKEKGILPSHCGVQLVVLLCCAVLCCAVLCHCQHADLSFFSIGCMSANATKMSHVALGYTCRPILCKAITLTLVRQSKGPRLSFKTLSTLLLLRMHLLVDKTPHPPPPPLLVLVPCHARWFYAIPQNHPYLNLYSGTL